MVKAYTLGACKIYDRKEPVFKAIGGSVFQTLSQATEYLSTGSVLINGKQVKGAIYEIALPNDWESDVDPTGRLIVSAEVVRKISQADK